MGGERRGRVAVVVDSAASVPDEFRDSALTFVAPMRLHIGGETYRDGVDISAGEFYERQRRDARGISTSAPTPADFLGAYSAASEVAESALTVLVSGAFSASGRSAEAAIRRFAEDRPGFEARVLDSRSAAGGQGLIAWEALKAAEASTRPERELRKGGHSARGVGQGVDSCFRRNDGGRWGNDGWMPGGTNADLARVEARALEVRERVRLLAYVDTLYYLWKGGRVPGIAHAGASLLNLKPVFELSGSEVRSLARPRTARRARGRMLELMAERVGEARVRAAVMHADAGGEAEILRDGVRERFDCAELFVTEFTPVMGAHIGPGMVGVAFWAEE